MKSAVILANGSSNRYGKDKLSQSILQYTVLQHAVNAFVPIVDEIILVTSNPHYQQMFDNVKVVEGGDTRTQSVIKGLSQLSPQSTLVAIHDGARPFVTTDTIKKLFDSATKHGSAVPTLPVTDTIYSTADNLQVVDRQTLNRVQTPQVFDKSRILQAYEQIGNNSYTDDSQVYYSCFGTVNLVEGQLTNIKITYPEDLPQYKSGVGYDVHQLVDGKGFKLGGVWIDYNKTLLGHSDADVLLHAVMDALLGATGNKDIGHCFPDNDIAYKGADSMKLLNRVFDHIRSQGYSVVNVSATIMAQAPKLAPYTDQMQRNIATCLQIAPHCVNVGATTTEHLGIIGQGKGIACYSTCVVMR